jgi:hypothetical protein
MLSHRKCTDPGEPVPRTVYFTRTNCSMPVPFAAITPTVGTGANLLDRSRLGVGLVEVLGPHLDRELDVRADRQHLEHERRGRAGCCHPVAVVRESGVHHRA